MQNLRRFLVATLAVGFVTALSADAFAGFGVPSVPRRSSFDTSQIEGLIAEIEQVNTDFDAATDTFWQATEEFQSVVGPYAGGEFPSLDSNWAAVKQAIADAADEAKRQAAFDLRGQYQRQIAERRAYISGLMADPAKATGLRDALQVPEIERLKGLSQTMTDLATQEQGVAERATATAPKIPESVETLTKQIGDDPTRAGDYRTLLGKLNAGKDRLQKVPPEAQEQISAGRTMIEQITSLVTR